ncbi:hypothetical protein UlMin_038613 [Ulmus minor]
MEKVTVELIGNNIFILEFSSLGDQKQILSNGPWFLFKNLVLFTEISEFSKISSLQFNMLELWVQVQNVSLACMNRDCSEVIGNKIGRLIEVAVGDDGECWGKYLQLRVLLDITKPLKRLVRICLREGESPEMLLLQYERLPSFCHRCEIIGHHVREFLLDEVLTEEGK